MLKHFPIQKASGDTTGFYNHVADIIEQNINNYEKANVQGILQLLKTFCDEKPDFLDRYLSALLKVIQKLAREHVSPTAVAQGQAAAEPGTIYWYEITNTAASADHLSRMTLTNANKKVAKENNSTLLVAINLVNARINQLGDQKKSFLESLPCLSRNLLILKFLQVE